MNNSLAYLGLAVLAGAVAGDHASPISDTTILSATGAGCNVITHVTTQLPYMVTAVIASTVGYVMVALGGSSTVGLVVTLRHERAVVVRYAFLGATGEQSHQRVVVLGADLANNEDLTANERQFTRMTEGIKDRHPSNLPKFSPFLLASIRG